MKTDGLMAAQYKLCSSIDSLWQEPGKISQSIRSINQSIKNQPTNKQTNNNVTFTTIYNIFIFSTYFSLYPLLPVRIILFLVQLYSYCIGAWLSVTNFLQIFKHKHF